MKWDTCGGKGVRTLEDGQLTCDLWANITIPLELQDKIKESHFIRLGRKTTVCFMVLVNGYEIVGSDACVDPKDFDQKIGETWAFKNALDQLEKLEGYMRQNKLMEKTEAKAKQDVDEAIAKAMEASRENL
jgi:hypothetical protein